MTPESPIQHPGSNIEAPKIRSDPFKANCTPYSELISKTAKWIFKDYLIKFHIAMTGF